MKSFSPDGKSFGHWETGKAGKQVGRLQVRRPAMDEMQWFRREIDAVNG